MKKKLTVSIIAVLLVALLALTLAGCTISGTYLSVLSEKLEFTGKSFRYTPASEGAFSEGTFVEEKLELTEKDKAALLLFNVKEETIIGKITLKDKKGVSSAIGFFGTVDGKNYIALVPIPGLDVRLLISGIFVESI